MSKIIAFANQKGGVGKTSTAVNLCSALVHKKKKVLLIDADPQGNATTGMGVDKNTEPNLYDILISGERAEDCIVHTKYGDVIPSNSNLAGAAIELTDRKNRESVLKTSLSEIADKYDYIFIDSPPSLGLLTLNALTAADSVLVPMQCEYYAMEGLADLINTMKLTKKSFNKKLELEGIVMTMYDRRLSFATQVSLEIKKFFDNAVFNASIPRNVSIAEAPSHGMPINAYKPISKGASAYDALAAEFLKHRHISKI